MHTRQPMVSLFKVFAFMIYPLIMCSFITGCVSYRVIKAVEGRSVPQDLSELRVGVTTLQEALEILGAPDQVAELEGKDICIYRQTLLANKGLSLGIPLSDILGTSFDFSAHGELVRYDLIVLSFTPDGILTEIASEKGSRYPYLKTLLSEIPQ
jgi:hypothetical protein